MPKIPDIYRHQAAVLKSLAHPTRLFIADLLSKGSLCVCEITERVGADVSTVSKHLSLMRAAGIVDDRKQGLQVHYHLKTPCVTRFFACASGVIKARANDHARMSASVSP